MSSPASNINSTTQHAVGIDALMQALQEEEAPPHNSEKISAFLRRYFEDPKNAQRRIPTTEAIKELVKAEILPEGAENDRSVFERVFKQMKRVRGLTQKRANENAKKRAIEEITEIVSNPENKGLSIREVAKRAYQRDSHGYGFRSMYGFTQNVVLHDLQLTPYPRQRVKPEKEVGNECTSPKYDEELTDKEILDILFPAQRRNYTLHRKIALKECIRFVAEEAGETPITYQDIAERLTELGVVINERWVESWMYSSIKQIVLETRAKKNEEVREEGCSDLEARKRALMDRMRKSLAQLPPPLEKGIQRTLEEMRRVSQPITYATGGIYYANVKRQLVKMYPDMKLPCIPKLRRTIAQVIDRGGEEGGSPTKKQKL